MGISERREREKSERRKAILDCARELILKHGVERVSMEDIANRAELSKATLYLYFPGKEIIFNEICEESARVFLEHFKPFLETNLTGIEAMKHFWRGYVDLFGSSEEMIIIFRIRSFFNPGQPFISLQKQGKSPNVDTILMTVKALIDQCKAEGVFDSRLDSNRASHLLLSMFSSTVDNAARMPAEKRKSPVLLEEMGNTFQLLLYGFAKEGIDRSSLNILS